MPAHGTSTWEEHQTAAYPKLSDDIRTDVVIVGGGLAGVVSAYLLARAGKNVVVLEQGVRGTGATGMTTAFITQAIDSETGELITMLGEENARLVWQSGGVAIAELRQIVEREKIECEFSSCSAYLYGRTESQSHDLAREAAVIHRLGFTAQHFRNENLGFKNAGYLELPDQAKFHPLKFLNALTAKAVDAGVRFFENTSVVQLSESGPVKATTADSHSVLAEDVIVATHQPFNKPGTLRFKKVVYRSYVLEMSVPRNLLKEGIYWDQSNPFIYFRVDHAGDSDRLMLGGADHRADIPFSHERNFHSLERSARELLSGAAFTVTRKWSGPILESIDGLPFIGAYRPHRYLATGFSGNGMTYAVVAGLLLRDVLTGHDNPWVGLYRPTRKMKLHVLATKAPHYVMEFFGGLWNVIRN